MSGYWTRFWVVSFLAMVVLAVYLGVFTTVAFHPSPVYAEGEATSAEAEEGQASTEEAAPERKSMLVWLVEALGWPYVIVFGFLSFTLVALFVMNILAVRRENIIPSMLLQVFEEHLNNKRYQEAYELVKVDESFLGQVLAAGMAQLSGGYDAAVAAMQETGEEENMKMEHRLGYVALIGQISPMFGLLGTVHGMIIAFMKIAQATTTPKPSELAQGIGMALVTTLVGLILAIPAIVYYQIVRNRINRLVNEVGIISGELMKRFATVGAAKKA
ncbi:MAG: MotA/TolQ/ExbB proton channel family protein [Thermoguttaceae bacterium]|nr:MotA/TolQ/ExbB proton channel family protein [Thermoguttaceae bacterium]MDW8037029.1 MotA/TolQ/ExbB proton channel family protein [Thermoguttaceae bacterium]